MKIDGNKLMELRQAANVSRSLLAGYCRLTYRRIHQIETDQVSNVNPHVANAMATVIGCQLQDLEYVCGK